MALTADPHLAIAPTELPLLTDLYQLTMGLCYHREGIAQRPAAFELFVRRLPPNFSYLVAMGLTQAIAYLEHLRFTPEQIAALQELPIFAQADASFWQLLADAKFQGDVWAVPEGTVFFAHEPILRIEAPLWQAQLVETYLLNTINYQTLIATRAARIRDAAGDGALLLEFGSRRAFSPQAALWAARASLAGGMDGTSNVLAALKLGTQPQGTMAHALVMAMTALSGSEDQAFAAFHRTFPQSALLIDTFDAHAASQDLADWIAREGVSLRGVRLDSGDLLSQSQQVRSRLPDVQIMVSGDLDEYQIQHLRQQQAPIDGYGIGTKLVTGSPVNGVYKLVDIDGIPVAKKSPGKHTYPHRKQIFRTEAEYIQGDRLARMGTPPRLGEQELLQLIVRQGQSLLPQVAIEVLRDRTRRAVLKLPPAVRSLEHPTGFPVTLDL
jgi:nicotinate phosphoribosyltransferase